MAGNMEDPQLRDIAAELSVLRRGVEALFDQIDRMGQPPDYRADIGALAKGMTQLTERLAAVEKAPALETSAEDYARIITASVRQATTRSHEDLTQLKHNLSVLVDRLEQRLNKDRTASEQQRTIQRAFIWGAGVVLGGMFLGIMAALWWKW